MGEMAGRWGVGRLRISACSFRRAFRCSSDGSVIDGLFRLQVVKMDEGFAYGGPIAD